MKQLCSVACSLMFRVVAFREVFFFSFFSKWIEMWVDYDPFFFFKYQIDDLMINKKYEPFILIDSEHDLKIQQ